MTYGTFKKFALIALAIATAFATSTASARPGPGGRGPGAHRPPPPMHHAPSHHHHHGGHGWAVGAGLLGAGLIAGAIVDAVVPSTTVVYPTTTYVQSAPTVVAAPAVVPAAPAAGGYYVNQTQQVWVEGCWANQIQANGAVVRVWQPGHYETRSVPVWVSR